MEQEFMGITAKHKAEYPLMEIQDFVKLAYQSEFGPVHLAEKELLLKGILLELEQISGAESTYRTEQIGNGLSRISLTGLPHPDTDPQLLAELMSLTIDRHCGTMEGLEYKLKALEQELGPDAAAWLEDYRKKGCPPVSHSEAYGRAYCPHYRVLKTEYVNWFPALSEIFNLLAEKQSAAISVDGRCGSGKSSLAAVIEEVFSCNVFHMDDFYLPPDKRSEDWKNIPAGNMDLQRFRQEVLEPAKEGKTVIYRSFDCQTGQLAKGYTAEPAKLTVIEGSYSQHPMLSDQYDLKIFLTCDSEVQRTRLTAREGAGVRSFFSHWIPMEERYFQAFDIEMKSDVLLDTGRFR